MAKKVEGLLPIDPIGAFQKVKEDYLRYFQTMYKFRENRYDYLNKRIEETLTSNDNLYKEPYCELQPEYASEGKPLKDVLKEKGIITDEAFLDLYSEFISKGLMNYLPYNHQVEMLEKAFKDHHNVVITSGTGSGKTESFFLPLFAYLLQEANNQWQKNRPNYNIDWYDKDCYDDAYQRKGENKETRPAALRSLIMYPMNALVDDQISRLRNAIDSYEIRNFFENRLNGHRIFFGRYNGDTIAPKSLDQIRRHEDEENSTMTKVAKDLKEIIDTSKSLSLKNQSQWENDPNKKDALYIAPVYPDHSLHQNEYSSEMLTRWDMQECPPDILITNFSMLQIALMRTAESHLFDQTKTFYETHPDAVFHLIIDELHLYRGTSGTEIAYLIRMFLDRIGVPPTVVDPQTGKKVPNKQLRILASSASLGSDEETMDFLEQFFGVYYEDKTIARKPFDIQPGSDYEPKISPQLKVDYSKFAIFAQKDENGVLQYINRDDNYRWEIKQVFLNSIEEQGTVADYLRKYSDKIYSDFKRALSQEYNDANGQELARIVPQSLDRIKDNLSTISETEISKDAIRGFLVFRADNEVNQYVNNPENKCKLPRLRFHQFFKYVEGLWGELLPSTTHVSDDNHHPQIIGKLMYKPDPMVRVGDGHSHKVLELLRCEYCGELYIGGNRYTGDDNDPGFYMMLNSPDLEIIPNRNPTPMVQNKRYPDYAIFWPTEEQFYTNKNFHPVNSSGNTAFKEVGFEGRWEECYLNPYDGSVRLGADVDLTANPDLIHGYTYKLSRYKNMTTLESSVMALPCTCPHCNKDYSQRLYTKSPIRSFRSGISRSNQILSKELMYQLPENDRKLIGFSDSRQDAADQAHGIAVEHFRDMVRLLFMQCVSKDQNSQELEWAKQDIIQSHERNMDNTQIIQRYVNNAVLSDAVKNGLRTLIIHNDFEGIRSFVVDNSVFPLSDIIFKNGILDGKLLNDLISLGINPLGVDYSDQFRYKDNIERLWAKDYDFTNNRQHTDPTRLSDGFNNLDIRKALQATIFQNCFGRYMGLNTESVGLGYITVSNPESSCHYQQLVDMLRPVNIDAHDFLDAFVRIMGDFYMYEDPEIQTQFNIDNYDGQHGFKEEWKNFVRSIDVDEQRLGHLLYAVVFDIFGAVKLDISKLSFKKKRPMDLYYKCSKCGRVHLHKGAGYCTNTSCCHTLEEAITGPIQELHNNNFISYDIKVEPRKACRIHTEELTGQTDDQTTRLLDFKGIILGDDEPKAREIDMLNVTTTMEVGVDIGSLLAVYQGNMPPTRYNYQQRVGRGGRRGQPFSTAFTFCRGRSHDLFYYESAIDEITGGIPAAPKLSVKSPAGTFNSSIVKRVITKHLLKEAFGAIYPDGSGDISDTHGEFGIVLEWNDDLKDRLRLWLNINDQVIDHVLGLYMSQYNTQDEKEEIVRWINNDLIRNIDSAVEAADCDGLAEAIAEAGMMPMYGMPSGIRVLYHGSKGGKFRLIDRPIEQSITEFAPGAIKTKDHGFYQSAGLTCNFETPTLPKDTTVTAPVWDALEKSYVMNIKDDSQAIDSIRKLDGEIQDSQIRLVIPKAFRCARIYGNKGKKKDNTDSYSNFTQTTIWADPITQINNECNIKNMVVNYWNCADDVKPHIWYVNDNNGDYFEGNRQFLYKRERIGRATNEGNYSYEPQFVGGNIEGNEKTLVENAPNFMVTADLDVNRGRGTNVMITQRCDNDGEPIYEKIALGAKKVTEMICLTVRSIPNSLCLDINNGYAPAIKSAFYSAATLIQRYFADVQDIQPDEIEISDLKIDPNTGVPSIYLSDQLQNGSGYVGMLLKEKESGKTWLQFVLEDIVRGENAQSKYIRSIFEHRDICETSCARCLCTYRNSGLHHILDWRLGVDLIKLMLDANYDMGYSQIGNTPYADLPEMLTLAGNKVKDAVNGVVFECEGGKYYIKSQIVLDGDLESNKERIVHPLWNVAECKEDGLNGFQNFFELFRTNYKKNIHPAPLTRNRLNSGTLFD